MNEWIPVTMRKILAGVAIGWSVDFATNLFHLRAMHNPPYLLQQLYYFWRILSANKEDS